MGISAGLATAKSGRQYLTIYTSTEYSDLYSEVPAGIECERILHFSYKKLKKGKDVPGCGDTFLIKSGNPRTIIGISKTLIENEDGSIYIKTKYPKEREYTITSEQIENTDRMCGAQWEERRLSREVINEAKKINKSDIYQHDLDAFPQNPDASNRIIVDKIIPRTRLKRKSPVRKKYFDGGKPWFYLQCGLEANLDFSRSCGTEWIPRGNFNFEDGVFTNFFLNPWLRCGYKCYAEDKHENNYPKSLLEIIDPQQLEEEILGACCIEYGSRRKLNRPVRILRIGKRSDPGDIFVRDNLLISLEVLARLKKDKKLKQSKEGLGVMTTKLLEYDSRVAQEAKDSEIKLLVSLGWDSLEPGAVLRNASNEERIDSIMKYSEAGVNVVPFPLILAHKPLGEREKRILNLGLDTQVHPINPSVKKSLEKLGESWDFLKGRGEIQKNLFGYNPEGSYRYENKQLVAMNIHPEWLKIIENNRRRIRMCHHNSKTFYCGGCFQREGFIAPTIKNEIKRNSKRWKKKEKKKKVISNEKDDIELFLERQNVKN